VCWVTPFARTREGMLVLGDVFWGRINSCRADRSVSFDPYLMGVVHGAPSPQTTAAVRMMYFIPAPCVILAWACTITATFSCHHWFFLRPPPPPLRLRWAMPCLYPSPVVVCTSYEEGRGFGSWLLWR